MKTNLFELIIKRISNFFPIIGALFVVIVIAYALTVNANIEKTILNLSLEDYENEKAKVDSLKNVVDSLQMEIFFLEDGFDDKEHRYEDVIFEYEMGLWYLKDYHPKAYKDFHRVIGMKERYSEELKRENSKRLNQYKNK
jgi:hypothetical protein